MTNKHPQELWKSNQADASDVDTQPAGPFSSLLRSRSLCFFRQICHISRPRGSWHAWTCSACQNGKCDATLSDHSEASLRALSTANFGIKVLEKGRKNAFRVHLQTRLSSGTYWPFFFFFFPPSFWPNENDLSKIGKKAVIALSDGFLRSEAKLPCQLILCNWQKKKIKTKAEDEEEAAVLFLGANQWQGVMVIFDTSLPADVPELDVHQLRNHILCLLVSLSSCLLHHYVHVIWCSLSPPATIQRSLPPAPSFSFFQMTRSLITPKDSQIYSTLFPFTFFPFFFFHFRSIIPQFTSKPKVSHSPLHTSVFKVSPSIYRLFFFPPWQWNWTRLDSSFCESASTTSKQKVKFIPAVFF